MRKFRTAKVTALALTATLALAGCKVKEDEAPADDTSEESRSIFQDEAAQGETSILPAPVLPPLKTTLSFADGTAELTEAVRAEILTIVASQQIEAGGPIVLRGHSDSQGSDEASLAASRARAEAVRDFLVENGIARDRIEVIAFGEQNPVEPNALPDGSPNNEGRAANRRVEVTVVTGADAGRKQTLIESLTETEEDSGSGKKPAAPGTANRP